MESSEKQPFQDKINESVIKVYQNKFKFWEVIAPGELDPLNVTLALYQDQKTTDLDCIPVDILSGKIPNHQTAKLLYGGTNQLKGNFLNAQWFLLK